MCFTVMVFGFADVRGPLQLLFSADLSLLMPKLLAMDASVVAAACTAIKDVLFGCREAQVCLVVTDGVARLPVVL